MDVVIAGSVVVDLTSYSGKFPLIGETVIGNDFKKGFGGKGANQCVMARLLGAKVSIVGKVGNDVFGRDYIQHFKELCVNTDFLTVNSTFPTGVASITVRKEDGANQIVLTPGANLSLSIQDVENARDLISKSKVVLCQLEIPIESTYYVLKIAAKNNVLSIFNPAPIPEGGIDLSEMPPVDVFCPNEIESSMLTNLTIKTVEDAFEAIRYYLRKYSDKIKWPMVTLGALGVVYGDSQTGDIFHEPAPVVNAVDSTGAGDCFAGSLAYFFALCPHLSLAEKVRKSIFLASLSVQKPGTQTSFPDKSQIPYI